MPRLEALTAVARCLPLLLRAPARALAGAGLLRGDATRKVADALAYPDALPHPYAAARALFAWGRLRRLLNGAGQDALAGPWAERFEALASRVRGLAPFARVSMLELGAYLVNTLLRDTDAMSMAHSLEVRVPFVDRAVVEAVTEVPEAWRGGRARIKRLLVDALGDLLPEEVVAQRKRTFTLPWERWLRGALRGKVLDGIEEIPEPLRPLLDVQEVRAVRRDFLAGRTGWARPWALYVLNDWVRRHAGA